MESPHVKMVEFWERYSMNEDGSIEVAKVRVIQGIFGPVAVVLHLRWGADDMNLGFKPKSCI